MRPRNQAGTEFPHSKGNASKAGNALAKGPTTLPRKAGTRVPKARRRVRDKREIGSRNQAGQSPQGAVLPRKARTRVPKAPRRVREKREIKTGELGFEPRLTGSESVAGGV